jgi:hypothetical protein
MNKRVVISAVLIGFTIIWAIIILVKEWGAFVAAATQVRVNGFALVLMVGLLASLQHGLAFTMLLRRFERVTLSVGAILRLFFVGQVIRYLPGRFWHLVYQAATAGPSVPAVALIRANIEYLVVASWTGMALAALVLAAVANLPILTAMMGICLAGSVLLIRWPIHLQVIRRLALLLAKYQFATPLAQLSAIPPRRWQTAVHLTGLLYAAWVTQYVGWVLLPWAWPALQGQNMAALCAMYTLAWFAGYLTFLTPAGLGVREFAFAVMADDLSPDILVLVLLIARVWLFVVEIAWFGLGVCLPSRRTGAGSHAPVR